MSAVVVACLLAPFPDLCRAGAREALEVTTMVMDDRDPGLELDLEGDACSASKMSASHWLGFLVVAGLELRWAPELAWLVAEAASQLRSAVGHQIEYCYSKRI